MPIHVLEKTQTVRASIGECWDFFSSPRNLARITPPELGFKVMSEPPACIYPGLMIEYRVTPLPGMPMSWLTEITHVDEGRRFVDEQRIGPYRVWHHEHTFEPAANGTVTMHDRVTYALPFGLLGEIVHPLIVAPQLARIFNFRTEAVERLFPATGASKAGAH